MVGNLATSNQSGPFSVSSSVALVVERLFVGTETSTRLAAGFFGSRFKAPYTWVKSPYQVDVPKWSTANSTRVCVGSME